MAEASELKRDKHEGISQKLFTIRPIGPSDNKALKDIILNVLREYDCDSVYFTDGKLLNNLYSNYQEKGSAYWVVTDAVTGNVLGGAGYSQLEGTSPDDRICELQKMYLLPEARGRGQGKRLMELILQSSKSNGYREIYLDTDPKLVESITLYSKYGFKRLKNPKGNTGHNTCSVFMSRLL